MKKYLFLSITSLLLASFMVACEDEDTPSKSDFDIDNIRKFYLFILSCLIAKNKVIK